MPEEQLNNAARSRARSARIQEQIRTNALVAKLELASVVPLLAFDTLMRGRSGDIITGVGDIMGATMVSWVDLTPQNERFVELSTPRERFATAFRGLAGISTYMGLNQLTSDLPATNLAHLTPGVLTPVAMYLVGFAAERKPLQTTVTLLGGALGLAAEKVMAANPAIFDIFNTISLPEVTNALKEAMSNPAADIVGVLTGALISLAGIAYLHRQHPELAKQIFEPKFLAPEEQVRISTPAPENIDETEVKEGSGKEQGDEKGGQAKTMHPPAKMKE